MNKKQVAVLKRMATILKKRQLKEMKKIENEFKRLLNAGFMFTNENKKNNEVIKKARGRPFGSIKK